MNHKKRGATALTDSAKSLEPAAGFDSSVNASNEETCLLSSGSWVRIPPGTPRKSDFC